MLLRNRISNEWLSYCALFGVTSWLFLFPLRLYGLRLVDLVLFAVTLFLIINKRFLKTHIDRNILALSFLITLGVLMHLSNALLLLRLSSAVLLYYMAIFYMTDKSKEYIFKILFIALVFHISIGLYQVFFSFYYFDEYGQIYFGTINRARGFLENSVFFAAFLCVGGLTAILYAQTYKLKIFLLVIVTIGLFISGTRGASVAFFCGLCVFLFNQRFIYAFVISISFLFPLLLSYLTFHPVAPFESTSEGLCFVMQPDDYFDKSYGMRLEKLNFALNKILEGDFFGSGFGRCIGGGADLLFSRYINDFGIIGLFIWLVLFIWLYLIKSRYIQSVCSCLAVLSLSFDVLYSYVTLLSLISASLIFSRKNRKI